MTITHVAVVETHQGVLERHGYVCLELVSTCEGTLGLGRITYRQRPDCPGGTRGGVARG
jgi:hypothetical protein